MQVTLTKIQRFTKDKEGNDLIAQSGFNKGKPFTRLVIYTQEHEKSLSGFDSAVSANWKEGDKVEIEVKENGQYLNFSVPKTGGSMTQEDRDRLLRVEIIVTQILSLLKTKTPELDDEPPF